MWISKKKCKNMEKIIANLERQVQSQQSKSNDKYLPEKAFLIACNAIIAECREKIKS